MSRNLKRDILIFEFWAHDIATDIAEEVLSRLGIPYRVRIRRKMRDPGAPKGCKFDEWAEICVDAKELTEWIERKIDEEINSY